MADAHPHPAGHPTERLVGTAPAVATLRTQICHLAPFDTVGSPHVPTVLLQGETGTGKGLVARVIHDSGPRASGPFIAVNCAAIPDTMLEAELFGFEPGAFTDAKRTKPGLFEAASGGTLFLDEVDTLPLALQGKLLTAIETKRVRRLGAVTERSVDVKLIAATNAALSECMAMGRFRADLYHRLAVVVLALPPLRERGADMLLLAQAQLALDEAVPLVAELMALPLSEAHDAPQPLSAEQRRQRTLDVLLALLAALAEQQPMLLIVEDLHWVDPSTLELLALLIDQVPTARIYTVLTCRPGVQPPWGFRTHLTPLVLNRLTPSQVEAMVGGMPGGRRLSTAVLEQIVAQTDGIPCLWKR